MQTVYIERQIQAHPRVKQILKKIKPQRAILCESYQELFNRKSQSFRLQKKSPALILAKKHGTLLHEIPKKYGIGSSNNYYFSHLLNCPFDCEYCFLQGQYRSANYVLFVNYEDFQAEIAKLTTEKTHIFTGYDADSLALEAKTAFVQEFYPFFQKCPHIVFELRTKSIFHRVFFERDSLFNVVIAYTLSPDRVCREMEHKAPSLQKRLKAIHALQKENWLIGLRFDPIVYLEDFEKQYATFFAEVFHAIDANLIHSVTLGTFRIPKTYFKTMNKNVRNKPLLATLQESFDQQFSYDEKKVQQMLSYCRENILQWIPSNKLFICQKYS